MNCFTSAGLPTIVRCLMVLAVVIAPQVAHATVWQAIVGAQTTDEGIQALAFLSNELWIHAGDSITWTFPTHEIHTVTFLKPGHVRPPRPGAGGGCPGTTPDGSTFDGSKCVTSGDDDFVDGKTYTVTFPTAGNFKLVCLVHNNMTGAIHVLDNAEALPHDQAFYDDQAHKDQSQLLADGARLKGRGTATAQQSSGDEVTVGIGEIVANGGGSHTVSVMRFLQDTIVVRVGDTVEWTNLDPVTPHTVTFGTEPAGPPQPPSAGVTLETDLARHAVLTSPTQSVHSGFLAAAFQDIVGLPQTGGPGGLPLPVTRFRVTFESPGTFNYICALHDDLGMKGTVIVKPSH